MTEASKRQSAKIYQLSLVRSSKQATVTPKNGDLLPGDSALRFVSTGFGDGWYHDAAIAEEARRPKR